MRRKHEAGMWNDLSPPDAAHVLMRCYIERAGEEALFRAFLSERDMKRDQARFWMRVYDRIAPAPSAEQ